MSGPQVLNHGYLAKETPTVTVSTAISDSTLQDQLNNFTRLRYTPPYCYTYNTNYTWGPGREYIGNECSSYYTGPEFTAKAYMGVWLYTFWQQQIFQRACVVPTAPAGLPLHVNYNLSGLPVCGPPVQLYNASVIPVASEFVTVTITGTYTTSWGRTRSSMNTTFQSAPSVTGPPLGPNTSLVFPPGEPVAVTFQQLLDLAGIDLDQENILNDGGEGPPWPTYRITGIELVVDMVYQNYVTTLYPPDPFNFNDFLVAQASERLPAPTPPPRQAPEAHLLAAGVPSVEGHLPRAGVAALVHWHGRHHAGNVLDASHTAGRSHLLQRCRLHWCVHAPFRGLRQQLRISF